MAGDGRLLLEYPVGAGSIAACTRVSDQEPFWDSKVSFCA